VNSEMHLEAVIERVWRCNWRPRLSELRDALGGCDRASLEMHFEATIDRVWRYALGVRDLASLEMHLEAVIERDWTSTYRRSMDGVPGAQTLFIG